MAAGAILRRTVLWLGGAVVGLVCIVVAALLLLQTAPAKTWLAATLSDVASEASGMTVSIGRIDGAVPTDFTLTSLRLADAEGVWLEAEDLALDWRAVALLGGRVEIDRLAARQVTVHRAPAGAAPELPEDEAAPPFRLEIPRLPVALVLRDLSIGEIRLGAGLIGQDVAAAVFGSAEIGGRPQDAALELELVRLDGPPGRAALELAQDRPDGALTLAASIEEPAGGIVARLLDLPGLPPVSLRLDGMGPATGWQGRLEARAGAAAAGLDLRLALGDRVELAVAGEVDPGDLAGDELRELLPGPIGIDAAVGWTPGEQIEIGHANLSASGVEARLQGRLDQSDEAIAATAELAVTDAALVARLADPVSAGSLRLTARASGSLAAPSVAFDGTLAQLGAPELSAETVALSGVLTPGEDPSRWRVEAQVATSGFALSLDPALAALLGDAPVVVLDGVVDPSRGDVDIAALDVTGAAVSASGTGRVAAQGRDVDVRARLHLDDVSPLGGQAGLPMAGTLDADLRLQGDATLPLLAVDLDARGEDFATEDAVLAALLGPSPHLVAAATVEAGRVAIDRARLDMAAAELRASGIAAERLDLRVEAAAADLAPLSGPLGIDLVGGLALQGHVTGPASDPAVTARIAGTRMAAAGIPLGDPKLEASLDGLAGRLQGRVSLAAAPGGAALSAATGFRLTESGGVRLQGLKVEGSGTRIAGDLSIGADGLVTGALDGRIGDLTVWQALAGTELAGAAELDVALRAEQGRQSVTAQVSGRDLDLAQAAVLRELRLDLDLADALGAPRLDGRIEAAGLAAGGAVFDELRATARGPLSDLGWTVAGSGAAHPALQLDAAGRLALDRSELTVAALEAAVGTVEASLAAPAQVSWGGAAVEIAGLEARVGGGRIEADARVAPGDLTLEATLAEIPIGPFAALAGAAVDGSVSGRAQLSGDPTAPSGEVLLTLAELREAGLDPAETVTLAGEIAGRFAGGRVDATAELGGVDEMALDARVSAPLAADGPLDGRVAGRIDLALLPKVIDLYGDAMSGQLDLDLAVGGSLADPRVGGRADLTGATYESASAGTVLRDVTAEIVGDSDRVRLVSLTAGDGEGGRVTASGEVQVDPAAGFPLAVEAAFDRFTALRRRDATVQATGRVAVTRDGSGGRIAGAVTVDSAELRIPERLGGEIVTLEVTEVNGPAGREPPDRPEQASAPGAPLALDVAVRVPGRAFLRGRGLESEWRGRLQIGGTTDAPDITGELNTVRGTLDLLGRNFRFDEGSVRFVGGGAIDPELAFSAHSEAEALTVHANVSGTASAPSIALTSEPALPQDEILARLLFGTSSGSLSPLQAVQLAQTAATLSGVGGPSVVDRLRESTGLDVLGVETGETLGGSSLAIGKYLTDDVFVKMNQGVTPESRRVGIEVRVLPRVTVESDIGAQSQGNVGVNWKLDY
ncbi:MAG: translocation/assembly module TamB [Alphaproteobacteria bacterium]|nr:MAG: translocation/assembly module TamB [Alphaproteobacteria bacterium]